MKLTEKLHSMLEENTARYFDVSKSLYALSQIVKAMNDSKLADELEDKSDKLEELSKKFKVEKSELESTLKQVDLQGTFNKLQKVFKNYEDSGRKIKLGRKEINLQDALLHFVEVSKKAKKEE